MSETLKATSARDVIFSNGNLEYMPFVMAEAIKGGSNRAFLTLKTDSSSSGYLMEREVHMSLITSERVRSYSRSGIIGRFLSTLYFCCYIDQNDNKTVLFSLVLPSFAALDLTTQRANPLLFNPKVFLNYKPRRRSESIDYTPTGQWYEGNTNFGEFWVNEMLDQKNKGLAYGMRRERINAIKLAEYFSFCGVKIVRKNTDELNSLMYKPKIEAYSLEQLKLWKSNMTHMVVDSFSPKVKSDDYFNALTQFA